MRLAGKRHCMLQKAEIAEGQRVDLNTGEIQSTQPEKK